MVYVEGTTHGGHVAGSSGRQLEVATAGIVSYSRAGSTSRLAEVVSDGARTADARVQMTSNDAEGAVNNAGCDVLAAVGRTIFGCPMHIGGPSSKLKRFVDPTVRGLSPTLWRDKRGGWLVDSTGTSGDKRPMVTYLLHPDDATRNGLDRRGQDVTGGSGHHSGVLATPRRISDIRERPEHVVCRLHRKLTRATIYEAGPA